MVENEEVELDDEEYMVRDLVGAHAYDAGDESVYLGEVVGAILGDDISSTIGLASDMLELQIPSEGEVKKVCYVPFVLAYVPSVRLGKDNRDTSTVLLNLPEGFLDLAVDVEDKVSIRGFLPG